MADRKAILVGISGVSSSGKTTLARLLRDILPNAFILHEDDFYKIDNEIPVNADGIADWDCLEAINLPVLEEALAYIKTHGQSPPDFVSKEDKNSVGEVDVDRKLVEDATGKLSVADKSNGLPICIIDGFLLYSEEMKRIRDLFDVKLFLRTDYQTAKGRREARSGYVTIEGFWEDPPGYVDEVVWPNYVKDHAFLFEEGDVEGELKQDVIGRLGVQAVPKDTQGNMTKCLTWALDVLDETLDEASKPMSNAKQSL